MTVAQVFSYEFYEIFKNIYFHRTPPVAASDGRRNLCFLVNREQDPAQVSNLALCFLVNLEQDPV